MKYTHVRYSLIGAYTSGVKDHPPKVLNDLGITYEAAVPQSIADCWQFFNVTNLPDVLPDYLEVFDIEPLDCIGWGLSEQEAFDLSKFTIEEAGQYLLNKEIARERWDEHYRKEMSDKFKDNSYKAEDLTLMIGDVELKGCNAEHITINRK